MNVYSQYIEDFVDQSFTIPRDIIRACKLIEEIDDMSNKINKKLTENRKLYLQNKRNKSEKLDDLRDTIDKDYQTLLQLNEQKQSNINEIDFLCKVHLEDLDKVIDKYKSEFASENWNSTQEPEQLVNNLVNQSFKNDKDKIKSSLNKSFNNVSLNGINNISHISNGGNDKKKKKINNLSLNHDSLPDINKQNYDDGTSNYFSENNQENEVYCFCQGVSYGDMVGCDNPTCKYQWFHFGCVNLEVQPKGRWFCSEECREKEKKKKK